MSNLRNLRPIFKKTRFTLLALCFCLPTFTSRILSGDEYVDEIGRRVEVKGSPQRIVSLAPSITEILFSIGAGEKIVGVTDFCDYPQEAKRKERIGGFVNPSIEKILVLKPDLIIGTKDGNDPRVIDRLISLGLNVYIVNPRDFESVLKSIRNISNMVGMNKQGEAVVQTMERVRDEVLHKVRDKKKKRVLFLYGTDPLIGAGRGTFADDLIRIAGGTNVLSDLNISYPRINLEEAIIRKPEVVIISEMNGPESEMRRLTEVFKDRVKRIDGNLINRPSPRLAQGLKELVRLIHGVE